MILKLDDIEIMEISQYQVKCLQHDLLSPKDWLIAGVTGKIKNCKKRMFRQWIPILRERDISIPPNDADLIALILSQGDYKNRQER